MSENKKTWSKKKAKNSRPEVVRLALGKGDDFGSDDIKKVKMKMRY